jgi:hypothetical protein
MRRSRAIVAFVASLALGSALLTATSFVADPPAARAATEEATASGANFNAGNIISNDTFFNSAAMSPDSIQAFLNEKVVNCAGTNGQSCLKTYSQNTTDKAADAYCSALSGRASELASSIVYRVGQACGINPQVLLVMLQKEQGLVQSTAPTATQYKIAMGYGCPDTAPCDTAYYGFYNQVYNAAHQFQRYTKTSSSWSYQPGRNNNIYYHPNAVCGTKSVYIENQATANLYLYTPYTPNQAALNAGYGTGDSCSAYGNRNFYLYFTDWFGNPSNWLQSSSFEGGSVAGWAWSAGAINRAAYNDPRTAQSGNYFLATNTDTPGRAVTQDVQRTTNVGESAIATVWLRSGSAAPFSGEIAVWGLGGQQNEVTVQKFTVQSTWTSFTVKLPVKKNAHSSIRLDVYMATTGSDLYMDSTSLTFGATPKPQNELTNPSFEGSFANWVPGNGFINQQIYNDPNTAVDGSWFAASNTGTSGRSFSQTINTPTTANQRWTFSVWLRSESGSIPFTGTLALWGLGGSSNVASTTPFTVDSNWTKVSVTTDVRSSGANQLKAEVYMGSTNTTLWLDGGSLSDNLLSSGSFESASSAGWVRGVSSMNLAVYSRAQTQPQDGDFLAATNTPVASSSLYQVVAARPQAGENYTAELWVKSAGATPFKGRLAVWALGGATEAASAPFTTTDTWTKVSFSVPITHDDHTQFKFEIYEDSTDSTMLLDAAQLY